MSSDRTYATKEPICDELLALYLINEARGPVHHFLTIPNKGYGEPEINNEYWGAGPGQMEFGHATNFLIDLDLAQALVAEKRAWFREIPFNSVHHLTGKRRFELNARGEADYYRKLRASAEEAKKLLQPGTHSRWSGTFNTQRSEWEYELDSDHLRTYRLEHRFKTPAGDEVQVCGDEITVIKFCGTQPVS